MVNYNQFTIKGFIVWGVCALFFLYEFFLRTVTGTFQPSIMRDLGLSSFQFSFLSTTIFLTFYGIMQIPVGVIVDYLGLKKSLLIGITICFIASIGFSYSYSYSFAIFYRLLMGLGASFGFICLLVSIHDWMPHHYSALMIGISQFIGTLGPMLGAGPLETLSEGSFIGWRVTFLFLGGVGLFLLSLVWFFVENNQQKTGAYIILHRPGNTKASILKLFFRFQPWSIALFSACVYFSIEYLSENEGRAFLCLKQCSPSFSSYTISMAWLGYALGCPLVGFLSDFFQRRKTIMALFSFLGVISIITIIMATHKIFLISAFFFLGVGSSGQSIGFSIIAEQFKRQFVAIAFGLNNAMICLISAINAPFIGWLIDYSSSGCPLTLKDYYFSFSVLIVFSFLSFLLSFFFIKETYCKSRAEFTYLKLKN